MSICKRQQLMNAVVHSRVQCIIHLSDGVWQSPCACKGNSTEAHCRLPGRFSCGISRTPAVHCVDDYHMSFILHCHSDVYATLAAITVLAHRTRHFLLPDAEHHAVRTVSHSVCHGLNIEAGCHLCSCS